MQLEPQDKYKTIWRYMDFTKFVSLLDKSALFFASADKLGDPFEGSHGKAYVEFMASSFVEDDSGKVALKTLRLAYEKLRKFTAVNCWHLNEHESVAMWKLYLKSNEGIAIQSTIRSLKNSIKDKEHDIYVGKVKYIDYEKEIMSGGLDEGGRYPFFHKGKSFEHEQELRLIIQEFKTIKSGGIKSAKPPFRNGIYVPVDLDLLIERIYLAPTGPEWLFELVMSVTRRYGLDKEVHQSKLDEKPVY